MNALVDDFTTLHADVTGKTAAYDVRMNKHFPTTQQIHALLTLLNSETYQDSRTQTIRIDATYYAASNNGLIQFKETFWANGMMYSKHQLTDKGKLYLRWLERTAKPSPRVIRDDLRQYERRFATAARWQAALSMARMIDDAATLARELAAETRDRRALMGGAL